MPVTLTSPALGKDAGDVHTGPEEAWLLAQGYARQDDYDGPGVSNTGPAAEDPDDDLTLASNREPAPVRDSETGIVNSGPLDPAMTASTADDDPNDEDADYDFDPGGVNDEVPTIDSVTPATGDAAGGTAITFEGSDFTGATGATLGGVAVTSFVVVDDSTATGVSGPHAAGAVTAAVTTPAGTGTKATAFTYA